MCEKIDSVGIFDVLYECDYKSNDGHRLYHIRCRVCGWETDIRIDHLKRMNTTNCKHKNRFGVVMLGKNAPHFKNKRIGSIYRGITNRCYDERNKAYRWYGGKGIGVCDEWLHNPLLFEEWSLENGYEDSLSIDRINPDEDYCPENCRWVSFDDNSRYKSTTRVIEVDGERHTGREWADLLNIGTNTINQIYRDYGEEKTKEFIRRRKRDKTKPRKSRKTWMNVYGIE